MFGDASDDEHYEVLGGSAINVPSFPLTSMERNQNFFISKQILFFRSNRGVTTTQKNPQIV
jgi:hypothetical protein